MNDNIGVLYQKLTNGENPLLKGGSEDDFRAYLQEGDNWKDVYKRITAGDDPLLKGGSEDDFYAWLGMSQQAPRRVDVSDVDNADKPKIVTLNEEELVGGKFTPRSNASTIKTPEELEADAQYQAWFGSVPENRRNDSNYDLRSAWEHLPQKELEDWRTATDKELADGKKHLRSVYYDDKSGEYHFLKSKNHESLQKELDWYNSDEPDAVEFKDQGWTLDKSGDYYKYVIDFSPEKVAEMKVRNANATRDAVSTLESLMPEIERSIRDRAMFDVEVDNRNKSASKESLEYQGNKEADKRIKAFHDLLDEHGIGKRGITEEIINGDLSLNDEQLKGMVVDAIKKIDNTNSYLNAYYKTPEGRADIISQTQPQIDAIGEMKEKAGGFWSNVGSFFFDLAITGVMAEGGVNAEDAKALYDIQDNIRKETSVNMKTRQMLEDAENTLKIAQKNALEGADNFAVNLARGVRYANLETLIPMTDLYGNMGLLQVFDKIERGEELNDSEKLLVAAMYTNQNVQQNFSDQLTMGNRIGRGLPETAMFTLTFLGASEFAGAQTIGKGTEKATRMLANSLINKEIKNGAARFALNKALPKALGLAGETLYRTGLQTPAIMSGAIERHVGDVNINPETGEVGFVDGVNWREAVLKSAATVANENLTEAAGEAILQPGWGWLTRNTKAGKAVNKFRETVGGIGDNKVDDIFRTAQDIKRKAGFDGWTFETLEEMLGNFNDAAFIHDQSWEQAFSGETILETTLNCMIFGMVMGHASTGASAIYNAPNLVRTRNEKRKAKSVVNGMENISSNEIDEHIQYDTAKNLADWLFAKNLKGKWDETQRSAVVNYVKASIAQSAQRNFKGIRLEEDMKASDKIADEMINNSDGNIIEATFDVNGQKIIGTIVGGSVSYTEHNDGSIGYNQYLSNPTLTVRLDNGEHKVLFARQLESINSVSTPNDFKAARRNELAVQYANDMHREMDDLGVNDVWGVDLTQPGTTIFIGGVPNTLKEITEDGKYVFTSSTDDGKSVKEMTYDASDLMMVGLIERHNELIKNGASQEQLDESIDNLNTQQTVNAAEESRDEDNIWNAISNFMKDYFKTDESGEFIPDESRADAAAAYLVAMRKGDVNAAINLVDERIAKLQMTINGELVDNTKNNAGTVEMAEEAAANDMAAENAQKNIEFLTIIRDGLVAKQNENNTDMSLNVAVSQMPEGTMFPVMWDGRRAIAVVDQYNENGDAVVNILDENGNEIERGIDDVSDEIWNHYRSKALEPEAQVEPAEETDVEAANETPQEEQVVEINEVPAEKTVEQRLGEFSAKHGANTQNKLENTVKSIKKDMESLTKQIADAEEKLNNMPEPYDTKTQKAQEQQEKKIEKLQKEFQEKQDALAPFVELLEEYDRQATEKQGVLNKADEALQSLDENMKLYSEAPQQETPDKEPTNKHEFVSTYLGSFQKGKNRLNKEALKKEFGWSDSDIEKFRVMYSNEGGQTVDELAELIFAEAQEQYPAFFTDIDDVKSTIHEVLTEAGDAGNLDTYIKDRRVANSEDQARLDYEARQLGYEDAADMREKRMADAQQKLESLKDKNGFVTEEGLKEFQDYVEGLKIKLEDNTPLEVEKQNPFYEESANEIQAESEEETPFTIGLAKQGDISGVTKEPKIVLDDFTSREDVKPIMNGVYYAPEGYAVATNGYVLVADKSQYDDKLSGKIVLSHNIKGNKSVDTKDQKKGEVIEGKFPNWKAIVNGNQNLPTSQVSFDGLRRFLAGAEDVFKSRWNQEKESGQTKNSFKTWLDKANVALRMPNGEVFYYRYNNLRIFTDAATRFGAKEISYAKGSVTLAKGVDGAVAMMQVYPGETGYMDDDSNVVYYDWKSSDSGVANYRDIDVPFQKVEKENTPLTEEEVELRDALVETLRDAGIEVSMDTEEGQEILDKANNKEYKISVTPKENLEKDLFESEKNTNFAAKNKEENGNVSDRSSQNQLGESDSSLEPSREDRRAERSGENEKDARRVEEIVGKGLDEIRQWAKDNGRWIPFTNQTKLGTPAPSGDENNNYLNDDGYFYKVNNLMHSKGSIKVLFDRINIHNEVFPETQYEFVGFTGFDNGGIYPVFRQKYVKDATFATEQEIEDYMRKSGFEPTGDDASFSNGSILIKDLQPRNVLKGQGGEIYVIDPDIRMVDTKGVVNDIKYQRANANNEIFISNAEKAVEAIKQDKATPEQWLKMIEKNGGLKAGEDKWLGLSDWLKEQDAKTLTKQEVLDFINKNKIKIEEVRYEDMDDSDAIIESSTPLENEFLDSGANQSAFDKLEEEYPGLSDYYELWRGGRDGNHLVLRDDVSDTDVEKFLDKYGLYRRPINSTRLEYTTRGLDSKREIALTVPNIESWNKSDAIHFGDAGEGRAIAWVRFGGALTYSSTSGVSEDIRKLQRLYESQIKKAQDTINRGVTGKRLQDEQDDLRRAERNLRQLQEAQPEITSETPKRVLVIDEIQSKRHQEGREKGYYSQEARQELKEYREQLKAKYPQGYLAFDISDEDYERSSFLKGSARLTKDELEKLLSLKERAGEVEGRLQGVPAAPFEKNWMELAMKRMLRLAAEEGYDKVAWTTGEQQAERYNISKEVSDIQVIPNTNDNGRLVKIIMLDSGKDIDLSVNGNGIIEDGVYIGNPLSDVVGKELAEKILSVTEDGYLGVDNLRIGGEGMKGFYDKMIPSFMNKYGKQWGVKVGEVTMPNLEEGYQTMHSIDITPEMKKDVMEGQVMFFRTPDGKAYGFTKDGKIYVDPSVATSETPIHEYMHLWAEAMRNANPDVWAKMDKGLREKDTWEYVKSLYPELDGDELIEEVFAHFSGKRGAERLREEQKRMTDEAKGKRGIAKVAKIFDNIRKALSKFWNAARKLFAGNNEGLEKLSIEDLADMATSDMLNGFNPRKAKAKEAKAKDKEYITAIESGDITKAQEMVDEAAKAAGYTVHAYHGTMRADRVGNVFRPERATSGPMAFFTDNRDIAESYTKKGDTSIAYDTDYDTYRTQFRTRHKNTGKDYAIFDLWGYIPFDERKKIAEKAKHVRMDWDGDGSVVYDKDTNNANGGFDHQVEWFKGNILKALNEQWLESGNLFDREEDYLKVLELTGVNDALTKLGFDTPRYMNPNAEDKAVYDVYLKIQNPFDTSTMVTEDFIKGFEEFADEHEDEYIHESSSADGWDKNDIDAEFFVERLRRDMENGTTHAWTSIPDVVTAYLKHLGHDGIKDTGGKNGGEIHTVWIPFTGEQVKRTDAVTTDDNGKVIPLSERFNEKSNDIRFQKADEGVTQPESSSEEEREQMDKAPKAAPQNKITDEYNRTTGANVDGVSQNIQRKENILRSFFDGLRPLEQLQKLVSKTMGRKLRDSEDAYKLATLLPSLNKAEMDAADMEYYNPTARQFADLVKLVMTKEGLAYADALEKVNNYLLAKHGLERNEWFQKNNPESKEKDRAGLRGLAKSVGENEEDYKAVAEKIVKDFEGNYDANKFWTAMRALTNRILEIGYEKGMINKATLEELKKRFEFYVPLRGFAETTADDMFDYVRTSPYFQNVFQKAKGRTSKADDPMSNVRSMLQSNIVLGNHNRVMQRIYNMAVNSKSDLLRIIRPWFVYDEGTNSWVERYPEITEDMTADEIDAAVNDFNERMQKLAKEGKAQRKTNTLDVGATILKYQAKEHEMVTYIDGERVVVTIAGNPLVAQQLNSVAPKQLGAWAEKAIGVTRLFSMINTSLSPAFMFTNAARDIGFSLFSAFVTGGGKKNIKMLWNIMKAAWVLPRLIATGKMDGGIVKMLNKEEAAKLEQWWHEFISNGGETGFVQTLNAEKMKGKVDDMIKRMVNHPKNKDGEAAWRKATLDVIETMGRYSEDISRFAAYCLKRAEGESVQKSITEAKNVTVNFNVKGGGNSWLARAVASMRAIYSFFNAALQGINRMARLAKENPKRFAAGLTTCVLQGFMLPWLNMAMLGLLGGDDDDWRRYEMLTEYTANHSLVLYVGNHKFIRIPYSQELAPFAAMGNIFFRQQQGWNHGSSVAAQIADMFVDLAPINVGESKTFLGKIAKTASPTFIKPITELLLNEDFTGAPIYKKNEHNRFDRGWEKAYEGKTSKWLIDASKYLDDKTNIDINPAMVEHIAQGLFGGLGRSGDRLLRFVSNGFQLSDTPFIRTLMFSSNPISYKGAVSKEYGRLAYDVLDKTKAKIDRMSNAEFIKFMDTDEYKIADAVCKAQTGKSLLGTKVSDSSIDKDEKQYKKAKATEGLTDEQKEMLEQWSAEITEEKMELIDEITQIKFENAGNFRKSEMNAVNEIKEKSKTKYQEKHGKE